MDKKAPSLPATPTYQEDPRYKQGLEQLFGLGGRMTSFEGFSYFAMAPIIMFVIFTMIIFAFFKYASKNNSKTYQRNYTSSGDRHCTSCHESIAVNYEFCPYCGAEQSEYVICDYCGKQNSKHDLMCSNCNGLLK